MIEVHVPEDGRQEETEKFYNMLQKEVDKSVKTNHLIIAAALNTRVGNIPIPGLIGTQGESTINEKNILRTFVNFNKLKVTNSFFIMIDNNNYVHRVLEVLNPLLII